MRYFVFFIALISANIAYANSPPEIFTDFTPLSVINEGDTISFRIWASDPDGDDISEIYITKDGVNDHAGHYISFFDGETVVVEVMKMGSNTGGASEICFGVNESKTEALLSRQLCINPFTNAYWMVFCNYRTIVDRFKEYATQVGMKPGFTHKIDTGSAKAEEGIFYGDINELQFVANSIGCASCKPSGRMGANKLTQAEKTLLFAHWGDWTNWSAWFSSSTPSAGIVDGPGFLSDGTRCIDEGWSLP